MKKLLYLLLTLTCLMSCEKKDVILDVPVCNNIAPTGFAMHSKSNEIDELLHKYRDEGVPGISVVLYHPSDGLYVGVAGEAGIENDIELQNCHLFPSASLSKMYAAVMTLSLNEQGILDINDPIKDHLSDDLIQKIPNGNTVLIKQLLNHSSGILDHESSIKLTWDAFHNPQLTFASDLDRLEYIYDKAPLFDAGTSVSYSTSGIIIEDLILEAITNQNHADLFDQIIKTPHGLTNTYFSNAANYPFIEGSVNTYWDVYGNGNLINSNAFRDDTSEQHYLGSAKVFFTAFDLFLFMKGVFEDNWFFADATLDMMKEITYEDNSTADGYGLGLEIKVGSDYTRYGHQGGSIGVATHAYWYENGGIIVLLSNVAGFGASPLTDLISSNELEDTNTLLGELEHIVTE